MAKRGGLGRVPGESNTRPLGHYRPLRTEGDKGANPPCRGRRTVRQGSSARRRAQAPGRVGPKGVARPAGPHGPRGLLKPHRKNAV